MAITPSVIYEVDKSITDRFYAVERAGYTDVGSVIRDVITDMQRYQWFSVKVTKIIDRNNFIVSTYDWPPTERVIEVNKGGKGYASGNWIEAVLPTGANIKFTVNTVANGTVGGGAITAINVKWPGNYQVSTQANIQTVYAATKETLSIANCWFDKPSNVGVATTGIESYADSIVVQGNVTNTVGGSVSDQTAEAPSGDTAQWKSDYGSNGGGGTLGKAWPQDGFWFNVANAYGIGSGTTTGNIYIGQTVEIDTSASYAVTSNIPSDTRIVQIGTFKRKDGWSVKANADGNFTMLLTDAVWVKVNKPITVASGDKIKFKGTDATVKTTTVAWPKAWRTIVEAGGAVDPLNDQFGVSGDVVTTTTNSKYVRVTSITTAANWPAEIFEGQFVTSDILPGSIGEDSVYVESVTMEPGGVIANVQLNMPKSIVAGETLNFKFNQTQAWRLAFDVIENDDTLSSGPQTLNIMAATEIQLTDTANITTVYLSNSTGVFSAVDIAGIMGAAPTGNVATNATSKTTSLGWPGTWPNTSIVSQGFINRSKRVKSSPEAFPMNYALTMTNRGVFFGLWEGNWSTLQKKKTDSDSFFNWFLVQRPVNRYTGKVLTKGRAPVFCINSVGYKYWKFIVREEDVLHPSLGDADNQIKVWNLANSSATTSNVSYRVPADFNTQDSYAILNSTNQVALTEDSKYLISFLHNLATPRFRYSEELDMIGQTSADVCMAGNDVSITAYNETGNRIYRALPANNPYNTGLRISVLRDIP